MRVHLILARIPKHTRYTYTVADGWDEYGRDGNRAGFEEALQTAADTYGWRNIREVSMDVGDDLIDAAFTNPESAERMGDLALIWRIEDGELELVTAWGTDRIYRDLPGFTADEQRNDPSRTTSHPLDDALLEAAFAVPHFGVARA